MCDAHDLAQQLIVQDLFNGITNAAGAIPYIPAMLSATKKPPLTTALLIVLGCIAQGISYLTIPMPYNGSSYFILASAVGFVGWQRYRMDVRNGEPLFRELVEVYDTLRAFPRQIWNFFKRQFA